MSTDQFHVWAIRDAGGKLLTKKGGIALWDSFSKAKRALAKMPGNAAFSLAVLVATPVERETPRLTHIYRIHAAGLFEQDAKIYHSRSVAQAKIDDEPEWKREKLSILTYRLDTQGGISQLKFGGDYGEGE